MNLRKEFLSTRMVRAHELFFLSWYPEACQHPIGVTGFISGSLLSPKFHEQSYFAQAKVGTWYYISGRFELLQAFFVSSLMIP